MCLVDESDGHPNQEKPDPSNANDTNEQLYAADASLHSTPRTDAMQEVEKLKLLLECREREVRQAAEYGLGLLATNEALQLKVATLQIRCETQVDEVTGQRDTWQRRTEYLHHEVAQWKRKCARVEAELTDVAENFEQLAARCQCRRAAVATHQVETIAHLQTKVHDLEAVKRANEAELAVLRQWKDVARAKHQELLESEALATQSDVAYRTTMEARLAEGQRKVTRVKHERDQLRQRVQTLEDERTGLKKQWTSAAAARDETLRHNHELSEALLTSEARCQRLQRELEVLEHVAYFAHASVDHDKEESESDDERVDKKTLGSTTQSPQRESLRVAPLTPCSTLPATMDGSDGIEIQGFESEVETQKKLYHYFHLTALSLINEKSLHERCFSTSSRVTIEMWYREVMARDVPFLVWHSWLMDRISDVATSVRGETEAPRPLSPSTLKSAPFTGFHDFVHLKKPKNAKANNCFPSPAASPVAHVPFTAARAFFSLLRKSTHARAEAGASPVSKVPINGSPAG